jgi:hypothetical protein
VNANARSNQMNANARIFKMNANAMNANARLGDGRDRERNILWTRPSMEETHRIAGLQIVYKCQKPWNLNSFLYTMLIHFTAARAQAAPALAVITHKFYICMWMCVRVECQERAFIKPSRIWSTLTAAATTALHIMHAVKNGWMCQWGARAALFAAAVPQLSLCNTCSRLLLSCH